MYLNVHMHVQGKSQSSLVDVQSISTVLISHHCIHTHTPPWVQVEVFHAAQQEESVHDNAPLHLSLQREDNVALRQSNVRRHTSSILQTYIYVYTHVYIHIPVSRLPPVLHAPRHHVERAIEKLLQVKERKYTHKLVNTYRYTCARHPERRCTRRVLFPDICAYRDCEMASEYSEFQRRMPLPSVRRHWVVINRWIQLNLLQTLQIYIPVLFSLWIHVSVSPCEYSLLQWKTFSAHVTGEKDGQTAISVSTHVPVYKYIRSRNLLFATKDLSADFCCVRRRHHESQKWRGARHGAAACSTSSCFRVVYVHRVPHLWDPKKKKGTHVHPFTAI